MTVRQSGRGPQGPRPRGGAGYSLIELLLVCAVIAIVSAVTLPVSLAGIQRSRGWSGTRFVAARLVRARTSAVARGAIVAVRLDGEDATTTLSSFVDRNRNGVLTREIDGGIDGRLEDPVPIAALFPGVRIAVDEGSPRLFSFSPDGTSTSGSIYVTSTDGTRFAVRVLGSTGRVRIERYLPERNAWTETY